MNKHVISDCQLDEGDAWVLCTCGTRVELADPERINDAYQKHRVAHGLPRRSFASSEYKPADAIRWSTRITIKPGTRRGEYDNQAAYRERHRERLAEAQREYRARKSGETAA